MLTCISLAIASFSLSINSLLAIISSLVLKFHRCRCQCIVDSLSNTLSPQKMHVVSSSGDHKSVSPPHLGHLVISSIRISLSLSRGLGLSYLFVDSFTGLPPSLSGKTLHTIIGPCSKPFDIFLRICLCQRNDLFSLSHAVNVISWVYAVPGAISFKKERLGRYVMRYPALACCPRYIHIIDDNPAVVRNHRLRIKLHCP